MPDKKDTLSQVTFEQLGLSASTLQALKAKGFEHPTPIQALTIPALIEGSKDIVGQAQTGTGKTAAFALPLIEKLDPNERVVQAIILTPTRELAIQVATEISSLKGTKQISVLPIYGGQSITIQLSGLKKNPTIIVGTPGRVIDHLERGTLQLQGVTHVVLDEADEMLNRGFLEDIQSILEYTPQEKQTVLFSATMSPQILKVAQKYMRDYELLKVASTQVSCAGIEQVYFVVPLRERFEALCKIIESEAPFYGLVFCRTKRDTERLAQQLSQSGYLADALNGDMSQSAREKILAKFKNKTISILVATDVAARGIDVKNISHVINYALPEEPEVYVHRIGRTGRAGAAGKAFSLISAQDSYKLSAIERTAKVMLTRGQLPSHDAIADQKKNVMLNEIEAALTKKSQPYYVEIAQALLTKHDATEVVALLLKRAFKYQTPSEAAQNSQKQHFADEEQERPRRSGPRQHRSSGSGNRRFGGGGSSSRGGTGSSRRSDNSSSRESGDGSSYGRNGSTGRSSHKRKGPRRFERP